MGDVSQGRNLTDGIDHFIEAQRKRPSRRSHFYQPDEADNEGKHTSPQGRPNQAVETR